MVTKRINLSLLLMITIIAQSLFAQEFRLSDYLKEGEKDVTLSVITMLQDASKYKDSKVIVEKGTYHFYPEKAYEKGFVASIKSNKNNPLASGIKQPMNRMI